MSDWGPGDATHRGEPRIDHDGWLEDELRTVLEEETAGLRMDVTAPELRRRLAVEDRLRRRSAVALTALVAMLAIALAVPVLGPILGPMVGRPSPSARPVAPATSSPSPSSTPAGDHEPGWLGDARTAIVVRWEAPDEARAYAYDGAGIPREIAIIHQPIARGAPGYRRPAVMSGTAPVVLAPSRVSDRGFLAIPVVAEDPADGTGANGVVVVDLRVPDARPAFVAGPRGGSVSFGWGPTGLLAIGTPDGATIYDPVVLSIRTVPKPAGVIADGGWAADGSGLTATGVSLGGTGSVVGVLTLNGSFVAAATRFPPTGLERSFGDGRQLDTSGGSEGSDVSRTVAVMEPSGTPGQARQLTIWYSATETLDGGDPMPLDWSWDASGTGIWLLMRDQTEFSIGHLDGPGETPRVVARLPRRADDAPVSMFGRQPSDPAFVGFRPDDGIIAFARPRTTGDGVDRSVWLVDTASGATTETLGDEFAGWALTTGAAFPAK